ncbi:MAG: ribonuclease H-like YkuK family protein [Parcubacteria group bacterium]|nr:ribonuclease H-like YkuK family protein [Parcubacteria group bacterium]
MNTHAISFPPVRRTRKILEKEENFVAREEEFRGFWSPSEDKRFTIEEVADKLGSYISENPEKKYRLIIGTDSQENHDGVVFVSAIILHRVGNGGRYFWHRSKREGTMVLRDRIHQEVDFSRRLAEKFEAFFNEWKMNFRGSKTFWPNLEIHVDIGENGATRSLINEIVGMVRAFGFEIKTKPNSYGASTIADRHT